jgi:hypothetical protein
MKLVERIELKSVRGLQVGERGREEERRVGAKVTRGRRNLLFGLLVLRKQQRIAVMVQARLTLPPVRRIQNGIGLS